VGGGWRLRGSWLSGFFIIVTDAWMQHPVAFARQGDGIFQVTSFGDCC